MLIRVTISAFFGLLFVGTSFYSSAETDRPGWSASTLVGKANTHPGPDCHNATLVAKGYEDEVATTSAEQISFYLERFCNTSRGQTTKGDIIAFIDRSGDLAHTVLSLGDGKIFEKESGDGLFQNNSHMNPYYQIKKFEESWYFVNKDKEGFRLVAYICPDAAVVREQMKTCETRGEELV